MSARPRLVWAFPESAVRVGTLVGAPGGRVYSVHYREGRAALVKYLRHLGSPLASLQGKLASSRRINVTPIRDIDPHRYTVLVERAILDADAMATLELDDLGFDVALLERWDKR